MSKYTWTTRKNGSWMSDIDSIEYGSGACTDCARYKISLRVYDWLRAIPNDVYEDVSSNAPNQYGNTIRVLRMQKAKAKMKTCAPPKIKDGSLTSTSAKRSIPKSYIDSNEECWKVAVDISDSLYNPLISCTTHKMGSYWAWRCIRDTSYAFGLIRKNS